jgi:hypothetical protein
VKTLYICGDSFASTDSESAIVPWPEQLADKLKGVWSVTNLSMVCASNLTIRMQVDQALENNADFIIVLFTSSVRDHGVKSDYPPGSQLLDDFSQIGQDHSNKRLACWSYHSLDSTCIMPAKKIQILKDFYTHIFDIDVAIYQNQCIIESTLHQLVNSQTTFLFDQGGFENLKFGSTKPYFAEFEKYRSQYNLWSLSTSTMQHRPYFHITDQSMHNRIAEYYHQQICSTQ